MRKESKGSQKRRIIIKEATTTGDWSVTPLRNPGPSVENVSGIFLPEGQERWVSTSSLQCLVEAPPRRHSCPGTCLHLAGAEAVQAAITDLRLRCRC